MTSPATQERRAPVIGIANTPEAEQRFAHLSLATQREAATECETEHVRSMGAPALTSLDLFNSGAEASIAELDHAALCLQLASLTCEFVDFRTRVTDNFVRHAEQRSLDRARIAKLEELVQEKDALIDGLRRQVARNIERLDDIAQHNDRIANTICPVVLSVDQLLNLAKAAPKLLALAEG